MSEGGPASGEAIETASETALVEMLRAELSALLSDRDVSAVRAFASGLLEVTRRGRRERLAAGLAPALFERLGASLQERGALALLVDGHRVRAGRLADGDVTLYVEKAPSLEVSLGDLEEEGFLPPGLGGELVALALEGHGLLAVGPARAGRERLVAALARELSGALAIVDLDGLDGRRADWLTPVPPTAGSAPERAAVARAFGSDALLALSLSLDEAAALAAARLELPLLGAVACASVAQLSAALPAGGLDALAGQICVVGFGPEGRARLAMHHAPVASGPSSSGPASGAASIAAASVAPAAATAPVSSTPAPVSPTIAGPFERPLARESPFAPPLDALPPLEPLAPGPPSGWSSSALDDDPGWELGDGSRAAPAASAPPGEGAFDRVLAEVKARPTFTPKRPPAHPQARMLQADPFGGLTFEPPGGAAGDDEGGDDAGGDDEEPGDPSAAPHKRRPR